MRNEETTIPPQGMSKCTKNKFVKFSFNLRRKYNLKQSLSIYDYNYGKLWINVIILYIIYLDNLQRNWRREVYVPAP